MQISFPGEYPEPNHGKLIFVKTDPPLPHAKYEFHNGNLYTQSRQGNREHHCCSRFVVHRINCLHFSGLGIGEQPRTWGEEGSPAHCLLPNPARWNVETPHSENKQVAKSCVHGPAQPVLHTQLKNQMSRCRGRSLSNCAPAPVRPRTESHSW